MNTQLKLRKKQLGWQFARIIVMQAVAFLVLSLVAGKAFAAGTLTPNGSPGQEIKVIDHHVNVAINNGFAKTEVVQTFFNPNATDQEGIYSFPVPESASLSEFVISVGEQEIQGEVLPKSEAERIYQEEKDKGNDAGLAKKDSYKTFQFHVARIPTQGETKIRFVYYQPLEVDTGVGRYVYPLEEGGTDDQATSFWTRNDKVENKFSADIQLRNEHPIEELRLPGYEAVAVVDKLAEGHYKLRLETVDSSLNRDLVVYYRLADNLPGRVELLPYRADSNSAGTFMLVVTPGVDLPPLNNGADYIFVIDTSGSMSGKIHSLIQGIKQALGEFRPEDRYRIITFDDSASELTRGWVNASEENVLGSIAKVEALRAGGSTNMYHGISLALNDLDADRATSLVLLTDAVTNTGVVDPKEFHSLMKQYDIRVFGFLLGNSANVPLMDMIAEVSGGFHARVSNADDIVGQVLLAKSKMTHEALHDAELRIRGVKAYDTTDEIIGKVYRGEQLVVFGRYGKPGRARITLDAKLSGADKTYSTVIEFPEIDKEYPELERLWALNRIKQLELERDLGFMPAKEADSAIEDYGVQYQLVTDQTSMVVLSDVQFEQHGVERRNQARVKRETTAQVQRYSQPIRQHRVDQQSPMFKRKAPRLGGGALDPVSGGLALGLAGLAWFRRRKSLEE